MSAALHFVMLIAAAVAFAVGGLYMKLSAGLTRVEETLAFLGLFCLGAVLQAFAMKNAELGVAYVVVLGLEAVLTVLLSVFALGENCSPSRIAAVVLVLVGVAWLRNT